MPPENIRVKSKCITKTTMRNSEKFIIRRPNCSQGLTFGRRNEVYERRVLADGQAVMYRGDCLEIIPTLPKGTIDAVITDPPYGIKFQWGGGGVRGLPQLPIATPSLAMMCLMILDRCWPSFPTKANILSQSPYVVRTITRPVFPKVADSSALTNPAVPARRLLFAMPNLSGPTGETPGQSFGGCGKVARARVAVTTYGTMSRKSRWS